jgi:transcriptional antiterminator RfaH
LVFFYRLLSGALCLFFTIMNWYAIYIKPKCEDSTALQLKNAGIEVLNPKIRIKKYIRGKYIAVIEPLFPSYIFTCFDPERHGHMIKYTRGVRFIVGKQNPLVVPQEIIDTILERMEGDIVIPAPERLESGDRVLIKEGPFANFYGIFERVVPGRERAMILLEALHCKLEIESISLRKA